MLTRNEVILKFNTWVNRHPKIGEVLSFPCGCSAKPVPKSIKDNETVRYSVELLICEQHSIGVANGKTKSNG